jgi:HAMP domain-containing protein
MVIERIAPGTVPASVALNSLDIWLQVHNLPFGFIQPKVGQAVGRFLGELKEYDHRNTVHSTYMRLKVRINVTNPLQKSWKVRANEGNFVEILFKYEKLGIFCFLCGVLGHTDKDCTKLFDMEQDDGVREWGDNIRPLIKRMGTAATNKYLQDPIPSRSQFVTGSGSGTQGVSSHDTTNSHPTPAASNLDGRLVAVQREISAIKSGILTAQKQALAKSGRNLFGVGPSHIPLVSTDSSSLAVSNMSQSQPVVMGLLAGVFILIGLALNLMLWKLVIQPVSRLSSLSDRVSLGELDAPEFDFKSKDEIGTLAESFTRMRKSMVHAMKMLDT